MRQITLVYLSDDNPRSAKITAIRRRFGLKVFLRNADVWNGLPESCSTIAVESADSPIAKAYADAHAAAMERFLTEGGQIAPEPTKVKVLRSRQFVATPVAIDIKAERKHAEEILDTPAARGVPQSKEGKAQKAKMQAKRVRRKL